MITVGELKKGTTKEKLQESLTKAKEFKSYMLSVHLSLPDSATEQLNSAEGDPIFLLPSVLTIASMRTFAEKVNYPVISLNITRTVNTNHVSISSAAQYYIDLLQKLYPNIKRYNLIGFDYGAMVAMKMARKGFPCRVAVVDLKQAIKKNINMDDDKLYDHLIEFLFDVLLVGAFNDANSHQNTKERMLRAVSSEVTLESKVHVISQEIQKLLEKDKLKTEEIEEVIGGSLKRVQAMFEYDGKMSQKKDKLYHRLLGKLGKAQGRFLVIKDRNSNGLLSNYFLNDVAKVIKCIYNQNLLY